MEIITLILTPLIIEPLTQWLKKQTKVPPQAIVAFLSVLGGSAFLVWQTSVSEEFRAWVLVAYPIFFVGAISSHKFLRPFFEK